MAIYGGAHHIERFSSCGKMQLKLTSSIREIQHLLEKAGHLRPNDGGLIGVEEAVTI
jgi:hypothetical protein